MTACVTPSPPAGSASIAASGPADVGYDEWADILRRVVVDGRVDYRQLAAVEEQLDRFVRRANAHLDLDRLRTPPTGPEAVALAINTYNATALQSALAGRPSEPAGRLDAIADAVLTPPTGGGRALTALSDATLGAPPLADRPYRPDDLSARLASAARAALDDPRLVRVDHENHQIAVCRLVYERREDLVAAYENRYGARGANLLNVLMDWATPDQRRRLARAVGYEVVPIPPDTRRNDYMQKEAAGPLRPPLPLGEGWGEGFFPPRRPDQAPAQSGLRSRQRRDDAGSRVRYCRSRYADVLVPAPHRECGSRNAHPTVAVSEIPQSAFCYPQCHAHGPLSRSLRP